VDKFAVIAEDTLQVEDSRIFDTFTDGMIPMLFILFLEHWNDSWHTTSYLLVVTVHLSCMVMNWELTWSK